jgi:hypothetical protein
VRPPPPAESPDVTGRTASTRRRGIGCGSGVVGLPRTEPPKP